MTSIVAGRIALHLVMILLACAVAIGIYMILSPLAVLVAVIAVAALAVLLLAPVTLLPAIALVTFVLMSGSYVPLPTGNGALTPPLVVIVVFALRAIKDGRPFSVRLPTLLTVAATLWIVAATILSIRRDTSIAWTVNFVVLVAVPALFLPAWPEALESLRRTWIASAGVLGIYAIVEYALSANPLYGPLYRLADPPLTQSWDVYRVTTTLGHPLVNGTFFVLGCLLACGAVLRGGGRWPWLAMLLAATGTFLTFSRGAVLALVVGVSVISASLVFARRTINRSVAVGLAVVILVGGALGGNLLAERSSSDEAAGSTAVRLATFEAGGILAREYLPLGAGPGLADNLKRELNAGDPRRGVESSWLQLLISVGIPGVAMIGLMIVVAAGQSLRTRPEVAAALVAYAVAIATYSLIESNRPALYLLGAMLALAGSGAEQPTAAPAGEYPRTGEP